MARLTPDEHDLRFLRRAAGVLLLIALATFLYRLTDLLLLLFGATTGAVLLSAVADGIAAHSRLSRAVGLGIAISLLFAALGLAGWLFDAELSDQIGILTDQLPRDWQRVQADLSETALGRMLVDGLRNLAGGSRIATIAASISFGATEIALNFLIILVGALFIAAQPRLYRAGLIRLTPPAYRGVMADALDDSGRALRLWLLTQLVLMSSMGLLVGAGLWLSGLESAAALGLLAGLSEFIPYVGPTLAMVPAIIIALAGGGPIVGVLATYAVVRLVQSNFLTPFVQREVVSIPPAVTLFAILGFGYVFGTFGLFFAAPLLVVAYVLIGRLYLRETLGDEVTLPGEEG